MLVSLVLLILILIAVMTWYRFSRIHELALQQAREFCEQGQFDLLDDTVTLSSVALRRNIDGRVCLLRRYKMLYYQPATQERRVHFIAMLGEELESEARDNKIINLNDFKPR